MVSAKTAGKNIKYSKNATILKIGHLAKAISHAKAIYSLGKILILGQKLKMPKTCKNYSTRTLQLVCAKTAGKNIKYSGNETILKLGHLAKAIAHAKAIALAKCSIKNAKNMRKTIL